MTPAVRLEAVKHTPRRAFSHFEESVFNHDRFDFRIPSAVRAECDPDVTLDLIVLQNAIEARDTVSAAE